jgi:uncharacterized membrane protein
VNGTDSNHADEAIDAVAELEHAAQDAMSRHQLWIERFTNRLGTPVMVYVVVGFAVIWTGANLMLASAGIKPFDPPPFAWLQGIVSLSSLLMTILILTTANRVAQIDTARAKLDLQINLLNERRTGKLIRMLDELRRDLPEAPTHNDPEVRQLSEPTNTQEVTRAIEERTPQRPSL